VRSGETADSGIRTSFPEFRGLMEKLGATFETPE
jgi:hypothetical protein